MGTAYLGLLQISPVSPEEGNHDAISYNNDTSHCMIVHVLQNVENRSTERLEGSTVTQHHAVGHGPTRRWLGWVTWPAPGGHLFLLTLIHIHVQSFLVSRRCCQLPAPGRV